MVVAFVVLVLVLVLVAAAVAVLAAVAAELGVCVATGRATAKAEPGPEDTASGGCAAPAAGAVEDGLPFCGGARGRVGCIVSYSCFIILEATAQLCLWFFQSSLRHAWEQ